MASTPPPPPAMEQLPNTQFSESPTHSPALNTRNSFTTGNEQARANTDPTSMRRRPAKGVSMNEQDNPRRRGTGNTRHSSGPQPGLLRRMTTGLLTPERPVAPAPGYLQSIKAALFSSWVNVLLIFIPVGWALYFVKKGGNSSISDTVVFVINMIAIIPLAGLLGLCTEEISLRLGETLGGLVNATLGNVVELIVAILALVKCEIDVVQSSLIGSILSNILLVLGMCFFAGGVRFAEQTMKTTAAQLNSSLLLISVIVVLVPSAFHFAVSSTNDSGESATTPNGKKSLTLEEEGNDILSMSHGVAILLLVLYISFMIFQMWSHAHLYADDVDPNPSTRYAPEIAAVPGRVKNKAVRTLKFHRRFRKSDEETVVETKDEVPGPNGEPAVVEQHEVEEEDEEIPQMNVITTIALMLVVAALVGVTAEFFVDSINGMVESNPSLSREWVGLILLPIVGNAAEHFTAVSVSVKDKIDLSISVAVGSSIQIALFVIPVITLLAWCLSKPLTLLFDPFESLILFFSVIIVNQTIADGRSNWMEGLILMLFYLIIAISFWYYPGSTSAFESVLQCK